MSQNELHSIRELLRKGEVEDCLRRFLQWVEGRRMEDTKLALELKLANFNRLRKEMMKGTLTRELYNVEFQKISEHVLEMIRECEVLLREPAADSFPEEGGPAHQPLHPHHQFTCDRVDQSDDFEELYQLQRKEKKKVQFYYLYGWEPQSHRGMFRRIAFEREGGLITPQDDRDWPLCKALSAEIRFKGTRRENILRQELVKNLFGTLQVSYNEHEPLLQKDLRYVVEHSPLLGELGKEDYVCLYIPIGSYDWDSRVTPRVARWFFGEFCGVALPADSPTFLFFFAVIFEEEEEEEDLIEEIRETVKNSEYIRPLSELDKVSRRDVNRWFRFYSQLAPTSLERKALIQQYFGEHEREFNMEFVQLQLNKIIDAFNNQQHGL
jgi:hypothetical protein